MTYICPNVLCRKEKCYEHCNTCGESVIWRPPLLDKEIAYKGPKPLNQDASVHRCMLGGTKDGRFYYTGKRTYYSNFSEAELNHHQRWKELGGRCDITHCYCHAVEAQKDPVMKAEWEAGVKAWLEKWEPQLVRVAQ